MRQSDVLLAEFERESAVTRRLLERVPEDRLDFRPHERSMSLGRLAGHVAELPMWAETIFAGDFDFAGRTDADRFVAADRAELLARHDEVAAAFRGALSERGDDELALPWRMLRAGALLQEMPRAVALRSFILSHQIHHRGQLSVYLRLLDVPLPSIYGPTADEPVFG